MTTSTSATRRLTWADFGVPALLLALSLVPTVGGAARLISVASERVATPDDSRFLGAPVPVVVHILSATLFCWLGAFQFSRGFRLRWRGWHRRAGRWLALAGLLAGLSGLWMTAFYRIPADLQGTLLHGVRLAVGALMIASIVLAVSSILRRNVARHEAFMIRAYALGQGAGTQALVLGPWMLIAGETGGLTRDLLMTLAWGINVLVAEWVIRRRAG
ncbi:MAG: DUF2306 domain-containing protein [Myxococcales bacterium]|nr:DUF2306 domain-containing protein [Myxococcales bacterium]